MKSEKLKTLLDYLLIILGTELMVIGIYFFRFPNHFTFGGTTGFATLIEAFVDVNASDLSFLMSAALLVLGFIFLGKDFGEKTVFSSILFSISLSVVQRIFPMEGALTDQPVLELMYAIALPATGSAILFWLGASSGGMDIVAFILRKYTNMEVGSALFATNLLAAVFSFFVFDVSIGLYSLAGLLVNSLIIDNLIASMNMNKYFTIICDNPDQIVDYIHTTLHHGATVTKGTGTFTGEEKFIIYAAVNRSQSSALKKYIETVEPHAFLLVTNSSEIIGRGFLKYK